MLNTKYTQTIHEESGATVWLPPDFYFWITEEGRSIYYQKGEFYEGEDLPPIRWQEVPEFFWRIVRASYSQSVIDREKLVFPEHRKMTEEEKIEKTESTIWKCPEPECGEEMGLDQKPLHIGRHRMAEKRKKEKEEKLLSIAQG